MLSVTGTDLRLQLMHVDGLVVALPETPIFLAADLTADPAAALRQAEFAGTKRE